MRRPGRGGYHFSGPQSPGTDALKFLSDSTKGRSVECRFVSVVLLAYRLGRYRPKHKRQEFLWPVSRSFIVRVAGVSEQTAQVLVELWTDWLNLNLRLINAAEQPATIMQYQRNSHRIATAIQVCQESQNEGNEPPKVLGALSPSLSLLPPLTFFSIREFPGLV